MTFEKTPTKKIWSSGTFEHHTLRKRVKYCRGKCHILCCRIYILLGNLFAENIPRFSLMHSIRDILGDDWNSTETTNSCNDYNKLWTKAQDCTGLRHIPNNNIFNCFKVIEVIAYQLIKRPLVKCGIMEFRYWIPEVSLNSRE